MLRGGTLLSISATFVLQKVGHLVLVGNVAVDKTYRIVAILVFGCTLSSDTHIILKRQCNPRTLFALQHLLSLHLIAAHRNANDLKRLVFRGSSERRHLVSGGAHSVSWMWLGCRLTCVLRSSWLKFLFRIYLFLLLRKRQLVLLFWVGIICEKYLLGW